jgi:hypothetical protein
MPSDAEEAARRALQAAQAEYDRTWAAWKAGGTRAQMEEAERALREAGARLRDARRRARRPEESA